ncbi:hypothetical protein ABAC460_10575 [Asticcacaulis sp. AC460]|uniref:TonB-dependent receptor n=1 Tax=Asticcacaulis sp. AC460 TaxID=1282360 RepID=UPI0003C406D9|nr:TonB-dependent receptor [Asticcacaulis sp. AC460]ESQ90187.1 hypothetical protein ABAC460_10575 [Asticcacaulis sp. AC460]
MTSSKLAILLAGTALAAVLPAIAFADDTAPVVAAGASTASISDADNSGVNVVITAQRRSQKVQAVPVAVTALGGNKLLESNIATANDVARFVPNLTGANGGGRVARPRYFLRGVGVNDPSGNVNSPTGIYIDDVYYGDTAYQTFPLFDLDRIEVLRGPQGTLWGKNTIGGAVNTLSRKPSFETSGYIRGEVGSNESKAVQGAIGGKLIDGLLAARFSGSIEDRGDWYENTFDGEGQGATKDSAFRLKFLLTPHDDVEAILTLHTRDLEDGGAPGYKIGTGVGGADSYGYIPAYGTSPSLGDAISNDYDGGPATLNSSGVNLNVNWHIGGLALTSITSYDELSREAFADGDNGPRPAQLSHSAVDSKQVSQELRLSSDAADRVSWTVGAHLFEEDFHSDAGTATLANVAAGGGLPALRSAFQNTIYDQKTESFAVFGEATWTVTDRFKIAAGARWTTETKSIDLGGVQAVTGSVTFSDPSRWWQRSAVSSTLNPNATLVAENTWERATYSLTPQYEINDNVRVYLRYATGFRSGGYNGNVTSQVAVNTVEPETLTDIEAGLKSEWLDNRLTFNASAFTYDYQNIQVNVQGQLNGQSATTLRNAANGKIDGIELELAGKPTQNLTLRANVGILTRAEYTDFHTTVLVGGVQTPTDASGNQIARAPKETATIDADYVFPLSNGQQIVIGADANYRSHIFFNAVVQNDPIQEQDAYTLYNARLAWRFPDKGLTLGAYVYNLEDREYVHNANAARNGAYPVSFGPPRTWGVTLTKLF